MYQACRDGNIGHVRLLLGAGADIEAGCDGSPWVYADSNPLHIASCYIHIDLVNVLIDLGADIEAKNADGSTCLHLACLSNNLDIVNVLIKGGADIESRTGDGRTPLHYAAWYTGCIDIVKLLIDSGANIEATNNNSKTPKQVTDNPTIKAILHMSVLKEWRPWNHSKYPPDYRIAIKTLVLLAKA